MTDEIPPEVTRLMDGYYDARNIYGTRCATAGALAALEMEPGCRICNTAVNGVLAVCGHHALHRAAALKEES